MVDFITVRDRADEALVYPPMHQGHPLVNLSMAIAVLAPSTNPVKARNSGESDRTSLPKTRDSTGSCAVKRVYFLGANCFT